MMITAICKCGKTIVWGVLEDGTKVPLDPAPAVYFVEGQTTAGAADVGNSGYFGGGLYRIRRANGKKDRAVGQAMVSHFITCPLATEFSGKKGKEFIK